PVVSLRSGEITGFEALARWNRPGYGLVQPGDFLPIAEDTGLIVPMGIQVLEMACAQIAAWAGTFADGSRPWVSVNLSAAQLAQTNLVDDVERILADSGAAPRSLALGIPQPLPMHDTPA